MLRAAPAPQRRPTLLFAAVHDVLLTGVEHELAEYYPSLGGARPPDGSTASLFADLVASFEDEVRRRIESRATQTNEPGRCAALRPAVARVGARLGGPLALIELGTSAGLLLHLDRYRYRYGDQAVGPASAGVTISTQVRTPIPPQPALAPIAARVGIDRSPLSPAAPEDARWLKACVWPEHVSRLVRLDAALAIAREHGDVEQVTGDLHAELAPAVERFDRDVAVCVFHSAALAYLDDEARSGIEATLDELGHARDLARIAFEGPFIEPFVSMERSAGLAPTGVVTFLLGLTVWEGGVRSDHLLARAHPHGRWLEWLTG